MTAVPVRSAPIDPAPGLNHARWRPFANVKYLGVGAGPDLPPSYRTIPSGLSRRPSSTSQHISHSWRPGQSVSIWARCWSSP